MKRSNNSSGTLASVSRGASGTGIINGQSSNNRSSNAGASSSSSQQQQQPPPEDDMGDLHDTRQAEAEAKRKVEAAHRLLTFRRSNTDYFTIARALGPLVFTDPVPTAFNSLLVLFFGNVIVHSNKIGGTCEKEPGLELYANGVIVASYLFLAILGWFALRPQVTAHIQWPYFLLVTWCGGIAAWTFVGIGTVTSAVGNPENNCLATAPLLTGFCIVELVLTPMLAAAMILKWFGSAIRSGIRGLIRLLLSPWRKRLASDGEKELADSQTKAEMKMQKRMLLVGAKIQQQQLQKQQQLEIQQEMQQEKMPQRGILSNKGSGETPTRGRLGGSSGSGSATKPSSPLPKFDQ